MDAVLGVAVTGPSARLALVGADGVRSVIDRSEVPLAGDPTEYLTETIAGTSQGLAAGGHRLVSTQVVWSDEAMTAELRQLLTNAGVGGVSVVSEADAATALVRSLPQSGAGNGSALLLVDDDTATLSIVGADEVTTTVVAAEPITGSDALTACRTLLERLREEPGSADDIYLVGNADEITAYADQLRAESPVPLAVAANPFYALAEGAAYAAPTLASFDSAMTVASPQAVSQLAYSEADSGPLPIETGNYSDAVPMQSAMAPLSATAYDDPEEVEEDYAAAQARPRMLLVGSTIAGIVVIGFAALAVTVAIGIRPTATTTPQAGDQYVSTPYDKVLPYVPQQEIVPGPTGPVPADPALAQSPAATGVSTGSGGGSQGVRTVIIQNGNKVSPPIEGIPGPLPPVGQPPVPVGVQPQPGFQMPNIPMPQINLPDINIFNPGQRSNQPTGELGGITQDQIEGRTDFIGGPPPPPPPPPPGGDTGSHEGAGVGTGTPTLSGGESSGGQSSTAGSGSTAGSSGSGSSGSGSSGSGSSGSGSSGSGSSGSGSSGSGAGSSQVPVEQQVTPPVGEVTPPVREVTPPVQEVTPPVEQAPAPAPSGGFKIPFLGGFGGGGSGSGGGSSSGSGGGSSAPSDSGSGSAPSESGSGSSSESGSGSGSGTGPLIPFLPFG